jgi:methyl-accepting chemotaxis protein
MTSRVATARTEGDARAAAEALAEALLTTLGPDAAPALVVFFASTRQPVAEVAPVLRARFPGAVVLGCSTAGEFTESSEGGASLAGFAVAGEYRVFGGFATGVQADPESAVTQALAGLPTEVEGFPHRTALLLVDSIAGHGEEVSLLVASRLGVDDVLAGGGAGDDLAMRSSEVALGDHVGRDALAVAYVFSQQRLGVGVAHGYEPITGPMVVTRAEGNHVFEIDGRPAWQVWSEKTSAQAAAVGLVPTNDGRYLFRFPGALQRKKGYKLRAILSIDVADDSLTFATGVPTGTVLCIAEGDPLAQLGSARRAAEIARSRLDGRAAAGALVFDCVVRKLVLGSDFGAAVHMISQALGDVPLAGFDSYGEIALEEGDVSAFHNATSVVLAFPE